MNNRREKVKLEDVANAVEGLLAEGKKPTMRAIHRKVGGGSLSTIQELYQEYAENKKVAAPLLTLTPEFQRLITTEIQKQINDATADIKEDLAVTIDDRDELIKENKVLTIKIEEQEKLIDDLKATVNQQAGKFTQIATELEQTKNNLHFQVENAVAITVRLEEYKKRDEYQVQRIQDLEKNLETKKDESMNYELRCRELEHKYQALGKDLQQRIELEKSVAVSIEKEKHMTEISAHMQTEQKLNNELRAERERVLSTQKEILQIEKRFEKELIEKDRELLKIRIQ